MENSTSKSNYKYVSENYDKFSFYLPSGSRAIIKSAADAAGLSINAWISSAVSAALASSGAQLPQPRRYSQPAAPAPAPEEEAAPATDPAAAAEDPTSTADDIR